MLLEIVTRDRMSNTKYHMHGQPTWWAYTRVGGSTQFLSIPKIRGDQYLRATVDVPPGTVVYYGVGPRGSHGCRGQITAPRE